MSINEAAVIIWQHIGIDAWANHSTLNFPMDTVLVQFDEKTMQLATPILVPCRGAVCTAAGDCLDRGCWCAGAWHGHRAWTAAVWNSATADDSHSRVDGRDEWQTEEDAGWLWPAAAVNSNHCLHPCICLCVCLSRFSQNDLDGCCWKFEKGHKQYFFVEI